ncbi:polyprenyl synthetase family protein [Nonomuraea phyllanthi]|uniref:Polyprenyl synthetase family protein n=1 Tax=Nonomuraea phyllanthi TaxID=2219224 RepID=A0A5C4WHW7_9ACTN|nr:polyprenyl synthetase family protein [Nonomuraea phyllanthi]
MRRRRAGDVHRDRRFRGDVVSWVTHEPCVRRLERLGPLLEETLASEDEHLSEVARHLVAQGGKRLRPALVFLSAEFGPRVDEDVLLRAAAAIELLHVATLYHDDVMDRAESRRGAPSTHARWGQAAAVTAGTYVFARAMRLLGGLDRPVPAWAGQAVLALALGQLQETENAYNAGHQVARYLEVSVRKTASLFELSCRAGAALSGADEDACEALGLYGRALGLAFQAVDDVLDVTADAALLGKRPGSDLREGVYGLPTLMALAHGAEAEQERLRALLALDSPDDGDLAEARELILGSGAVAHATAVADHYADEAVSAAQRLPDRPARRALVQLCHHLVLTGR